MEAARTYTTDHPMRREARALRIGRAIKRRRISLGLGQADLAILSGLARSDYELVETGEWPGQTAEASAPAMLAAVIHALDSELTRQSRAAS
jgi:transcriptional regulator with XRE-family HTH domain